MSSGHISPSPRGRNVPFSQWFIDTFECGHVYNRLVNELVWLPYIPGISTDESFIGETRRRNMQDKCHECDAAEYFKHIKSSNAEVSNWREQLKILNEDGNREGQSVGPNTRLPSPVDSNPLSSLLMPIVDDSTPAVDTGSNQRTLVISRSDPPSSPLMPIVDDSTPAADTGSNQRTLVIAFGDFPAQEFPIKPSEGTQTPTTAAPRNNVQEESPATVATSTPGKTPERLSYADVLKRKPITPRPERAEAGLMTETPALQGVEPVKPPVRPRLVFKGRDLASNEPSSSGVVPAEDEPRISHGVANTRTNIPLSETSEFVEDDLLER
ncbi:uncharacterized protein LAJ45_07246 [Morchella importuna]|uniref:uncharacterized protein n=1 Tax=Morchella importuna TaxID=1174673 RepID=UPI001E8E3413|nr:uncharacterized protein LAJ45_07246 [Morchella importuna]KAH8148535.1 hypothetical protein LAJ45_07246 [Morchella importuna]